MTKPITAIIGRKVVKRVPIVGSRFGDKVMLAIAFNPIGNSMLIKMKATTIPIKELEDSFAILVNL